MARNEMLWFENEMCPQKIMCLDTWSLTSCAIERLENFRTKSLTGSYWKYVTRHVLMFNSMALCLLTADSVTSCCLKAPAALSFVTQWTGFLPNL